MTRKAKVKIALLEEAVADLLEVTAAGTKAGILEMRNLQGRNAYYDKLNKVRESAMSKVKQSREVQ